MSESFFDDATRDLFDEILRESLDEYRAQKPKPVESSVTPPEPLPVPGAPISDVDAAWKRLHRSMYVLTMHRGRPHAERPEFQRKWLEDAVKAIYLILAALPDKE